MGHNTFFAVAKIGFVVLSQKMLKLVFILNIENSMDELSLGPRNRHPSALYRIS